MEREQCRLTKRVIRGSLLNCFESGSSLTFLRGKVGCCKFRNRVLLSKSRERAKPKRGTHYPRQFTPRTARNTICGFGWVPPSCSLFVSHVLVRSGQFGRSISLYCLHLSQIDQVSVVQKKMLSASQHHFFSGPVIRFPSPPLHPT